jgi:hypothetical protein
MVHMSDNRTIIERFVRSFEKYDQLLVPEYSDPITEQFVIKSPTESDRRHWQPVRQETGRGRLDSLYSKLPARLPLLFEELLLTFRWAEVDLKRLRLLANPIGDDLSGFEKEVFKDRGLSSILVDGGFIQFGKAADYNYDPICFDTRKPSKDSDCRIVRLDHEEVLCNFRLKEVSQIAPSFRELALMITEGTQG